MSLARRGQAGALLSVWLAMLFLAACSFNLPDGRPPVQGVIGAPPAPPPVAINPTPGPPPPTGPVKVALLLPLSGQAAAVGQSMRNAAEMALFESGNAAIELLPRDTGSTPEAAAAAARDALADGAQLILGPLFASSVRPVAGAAQGSGVNVIAFSSDASVAGGNAFVMGFVPAEQVDRVVGYAASRGLRRFAVLAPEDEYGSTIVNAMRAATQRHGGALSDARLYNPAAPDLAALVQSVTGAGPVEALMLPDAPPRLGPLMTLLAQTDLAQAQPLGTGQWDTPEAGQVAGLVGGWYASAAPQLRAVFEQRYASTYGGAPPHRLATLAYDAVSLAARLAQTDDPQPFDRASLTDPAGFAGVDGIFRFLSNGVAQRGLAVLEVRPGGAVVIDPAPNSFAGAVF